MKIIRTLSLLVVVVFSSCGQKKNSSKEKEELERIQSINIIAKQFAANAAFDTVKYTMVFQYQNLLNQNNRIIIEDFRITDVERKDTNFIVTVQKGFYRKVFIEFICTQAQLEKLYPDIQNNESSYARIKDKYLILKIKTIKKIKLKIDSYNENDGGDDPSSYIELEASDAFICKGEIIDTYLKPKK